MDDIAVIEGGQHGRCCGRRSHRARRFIHFEVSNGCRMVSVFNAQSHHVPEVLEVTQDEGAHAAVIEGVRVPAPLRRSGLTDRFVGEAAELIHEREWQEPASTRAGVGEETEHLGEAISLEQPTPGGGEIGCLEPESIECFEVTGGVELGEQLATEVRSNRSRDGPGLRRWRRLRRVARPRTGGSFEQPIPRHDRQLRCVPPVTWRRATRDGRVPRTRRGRRRRPSRSAR